MLIDKRAIADELTAKFSQYQYRLDKPMPSTTESSETYRMAYLSDMMFRAKVDSLVAAIMHTLDFHLKEI